jgi:protein SCO1/2
MKTKLLITFLILAVFGFILNNKTNTNSGRVIPDFSLLDHNNTTFTNKNLKKQWSLLFFGYTHCPDICPTALMDMAALTKMLKADGIQPPKVLFVALDSKRDKPEILKRYVPFFDKSFLGLTGAQDVVDSLVGFFGAYYERIVYIKGKAVVFKKGETFPKNIENYSINHSTSVYLISPNANILTVFPTSHNIKNMAKSIKLSMEKF